jgi:hypothetical protein
MPPGRAGGRIDIVAGLWKGDKRMKIVKGPKDDEQRARVVSLRAPSPERTKPPSKSKKRKRSSSTLPQLQVYKLEAGSTIAIDGLLNEPAWKLAGTTRQFVDVKTGKKNKKSPIDGRVKLTYDDEALYLGFELKDSDIRGGFDKQAKDPHLWTKDTVEIMVDPDGDGDNKDYYEIQISPQNLVFDSRFDTYNKPKGSKDGPFGHEAWSAGLTSAVTINGTLDRPKDKDTGYVVEAKLPWKAFDKAQQIPPKVGDVWRMNFYALSSNDAVAWSPILGKGNFHKAARFGRVVWKQERSSGSPRPLAPSRLLGPMGTRGRTPLQNSRDERLRSNPEKRRLPPNPAASAE